MCLDLINDFECSSSSSSRANLLCLTAWRYQVRNYVYMCKSIFNFLFLIGQYQWHFYCAQANISLAFLVLDLSVIR